MAYNQSPNPPQGWGNPNPPPLINTGGGYPTGNQQQPYQAPQFSPPPPVSPDKNGGNMLKTLNFFSKQPSFTPVSNTGATTLTSPVVGPQGGFFPPQGLGTTGAGPAPPQTTYNSNPIPSYSPAVGGPAGYQPVNPPTQQYPAVPLPGQYDTNQPPIIPAQQQQHQQPLQHSQTQHPQPQHQQQHQLQHSQAQHPQPQQQQQQQQPLQHSQTQHPQPQHQQQHPLQHSQLQPQHQQPQPQQHQYQQPQAQSQQPQPQQQHQQPQQNYHQNPPLAHPHPQQHQGSQGFNPTPPSGSPAPPPAYAPPQNGYGAGRPEKPTIQSQAANATAHPPSHPSSQQHHNSPSASNQHPATQTSSGLPHNAQNGSPPNQVPQGNTPAPASGPPIVMNNAEPDAQYWHALVEDSKVPMSPSPAMRSLFRGVAACISKECIVDHSPPCILSPTKMSMYYAALLTYSDRQTKLFSKARTHPSILTDLYNKLNCQYLLIPHPIGDGKRRPPLPALTIDGFEHWMLIQVLLAPDEEYQRLISFLQVPNRVVIDSVTQRPVPTTSIPRSAFPAAPNDWVVKRYAGLLEKALNSTVGRAEEIEEVPDIEGARKELAYFKQKSNETQSETHKTQAELVSTRKELDWIKTKLSSTQSEEDSARKRLAEKDGEIEWLKKRLAETQAELDGSKTEVEGLRRLNSARSGSVSSVSSSGTPYPTGGGAQGVRPPYPVSATPVSPVGTGTPAPSQGAPYYRQQYRPST